MWRVRRVPAVDAAWLVGRSVLRRESMCATLAMCRIATAVAVARVVGMSDIRMLVSASVGTPMIQHTLSNWSGTMRLSERGSERARSAVPEPSSPLPFSRLPFSLCGLPVRRRGSVDGSCSASGTPLNAT